jgi:hypothetical protein
MTPQVNSGWFQRAYPDHLDYFRLRSGPGNATYYGNGYGSPPWINGWGPGPGGWGVDANGYPIQGPERAIGNQGVPPGALLMNTPAQQGASKDSRGQSSQPSVESEALPPPK